MNCCSSFALLFSGRVLMNSPLVMKRLVPCTLLPVLRFAFSPVCVGIQGPNLRNFLGFFSDYPNIFQRLCCACFLSLFVSFFLQFLQRLSFS